MSQEEGALFVIKKMHGVRVPYGEGNMDTIRDTGEGSSRNNGQ